MAKFNLFEGFPSITTASGTYTFDKNPHKMSDQEATYLETLQVGQLADESRAELEQKAAEINARNQKKK